MKPKYRDQLHPLRKIVSVKREPGKDPIETLECGHTMHAPPSLFGGYRKGESRRCVECGFK